MENCPIVSKYYGNLSIFRFVWLISGRKKTAGLPENPLLFNFGRCRFVVFESLIYLDVGLEVRINGLDHWLL